MKDIARGIMQDHTGHYFFSPDRVHDAVEAEMIARRLDTALDFAARIISRLLIVALDADGVPQLGQLWVCAECGITVIVQADQRYSRMGKPLCSTCYEQLGGDSDANAAF